MSRSVLVVGGGKVGAHLAEMLQRSGDTLRVVEQSAARVADLEARLGGDSVLLGSGTDAAVLERAGIRTCDVVAVVTGSDETNLVAASLARFEFEVPRVIARVVDPRNAWMYGEDMGVDVALDQANLLANLVAEEMSLGEMTTLLKLRRGQFSLVEERVDPASAVVGATLEDVALPESCIVVGVIRGEELFPGSAGLRLAADDEVLAVVHADHVADLERTLGPSA
jgi:trk system potassium uptake protein TrkA